MAHSKEHYKAGKHAGHSIQMFRDRFWLSAILSIPIILYSELPARFFNWQAPAFPGSLYLPLVLASVVFFYGGSVFLKGARQELREKLPGMMSGAEARGRVADQQWGEKIRPYKAQYRPHTCATG